MGETAFAVLPSVSPAITALLVILLQVPSNRVCIHNGFVSSRRPSRCSPRYRHPSRRCLYIYKYIYIYIYLYIYIYTYIYI